jgi:hypothetical protein
MTAAVVDLNSRRKTREEQRRRDDLTFAINSIAEIRNSRTFKRDPGNLWTWPIDEWPDPTPPDGAA